MPFKGIWRQPMNLKRLFYFMKNREIKFRAWSSNRKEMLYNEDKMSFSIDFAQQKILISFNQNDYIGGSFENIPIMQFTGLKDKNGVDIYEGDIISFVTSKGIFNCEIKFNESAFRHYQIGYNYNYIPTSITCKMSQELEFEVIGNIHENPELLNG